MFPPPSSLGLNSDLTYLKIFQLLQVHIGSITYRAAIAFWVFLYIDVRKQVKGTVVAHDVWVSDGYYHDNIYNSLRNEVALRGVPELNARLAAELAPFSTVPLRDIYYLPGDQTEAVPSVFTGNTTSDVTIVLQLE